MPWDHEFNLDVFPSASEPLDSGAEDSDANRQGAETTETPSSQIVPGSESPPFSTLQDTDSMNEAYGHFRSRGDLFCSFLGVNGKSTSLNLGQAQLQNVPPREPTSIPRIPSEHLQTSSIPAAGFLEVDVSGNHHALGLGLGTEMLRNELTTLMEAEAERQEVTKCVDSIDCFPLQPSFTAGYVCPDPGAHNYNKDLQSWDVVSTKGLQPMVHPIHFPSDDHFINHGCRYIIRANVQLFDQFWLKDQNYSLYHILDSKAVSFVGGTVYQELLSPQGYRPWRSPVNGIVTGVLVRPGTYCSGLSEHGAPINTLSATHALVFIQEHKPDIGNMCFIRVGTMDISTPPIVHAGQSITVGQDIGMGSSDVYSDVLVFDHRAKITFGSTY